MTPTLAEIREVWKKYAVAQLRADAEMLQHFEGHIKADDDA